MSLHDDVSQTSDQLSHVANDGKRQEPADTKQLPSVSESDSTTSSSDDVARTGNRSSLSRRMRLLAIRKQASSSALSAKRLKNLNRMKEKEKEAELMSARLDARLDIVNLFLRKSLVDESFLGRKELNPWMFRNKDSLRKKWDFVHNMVTTQEMLVAIDRAKRRYSEQSGKGMPAVTAKSPMEAIAEETGRSGPEMSTSGIQSNPTETDTEKQKTGSDDEENVTRSLIDKENQQDNSNEHPEHSSVNQPDLELKEPATASAASKQLETNQANVEKTQMSSGDRKEGRKGKGKKRSKPEAGKDSRIRPPIKSEDKTPPGIRAEESKKQPKSRSKSSNRRVQAGRDVIALGADVDITLHAVPTSLERRNKKNNDLCLKVKVTHTAQVVKQQQAANNGGNVFAFGSTHNKNFCKYCTGLASIDASPTRKVAKSAKGSPSSEMEDRIKDMNDIYTEGNGANGKSLEERMQERIQQVEELARDRILSFSSASDKSLGSKSNLSTS